MDEDKYTFRRFLTMDPDKFDHLYDTVYALRRSDNPRTNWWSLFQALYKDGKLAPLTHELAPYLQVERTIRESSAQLRRKIQQSDLALQQTAGMSFEEEEPIWRLKVIYITLGTDIYVEPPYQLADLMAFSEAEVRGWLVQYNIKPTGDYLEDREAMLEQFFEDSYFPLTREARKELKQIVLNRNNTLMTPERIAQIQAVVIRPLDDDDLAYFLEELDELHQLNDILLARLDELEERISSLGGT